MSEWLTVILLAAGAPAPFPSDASVPRAVEALLRDADRHAQNAEQLLLQLLPTGSAQREQDRLTTARLRHLLQAVDGYMRAADFLGSIKSPGRALRSTRDQTRLKLAQAWVGLDEHEKALATYDGVALAGAVTCCAALKQRDQAHRRLGLLRKWAKWASGAEANLNAPGGSGKD